MRSNYKRLGNYIKLVEGRNTVLQTIPLMGLSITKKFIPSIANLVGTDMTTYRTIIRNQFAYSPVTSRNGDKITIALFEDHDKALISQAYTPFEVIDTNELLPEYLMMWFRRTEFDRYARFMSHGSARELFSWEDLCDLQMPIPTITKQKEIVKEYNVIENRIALNKQLIQKLEETAQAIYWQWFVDFEFPDENGKPYKSNGREMVFNEELEKEIPKGWEVKNLGDVARISAGGDKPNSFSYNETDKLKIPVYSNSSASEGLYGFTDKHSISENGITISARGAIIGFTVLRTKPFFPIIRLIVVTPKHESLLNYLFYCTSLFTYNDSGSAQGQLTVPEISSFPILTPSLETLKEFQRFSNSIVNHLDIKKKESFLFENFQNILLSKLATIEN